MTFWIIYIALLILSDWAFFDFKVEWTVPYWLKYIFLSILCCCAARYLTDGLTITYSVKTELTT